MTDAQRLEAVLLPLVDEGVITAERAAAMIRVGTEVQHRRGNWWVETLGYVGGALIVSGLAFFVSLSWEKYGRAFWVTVSGAITLALLVTGVLIAGVSAVLRRSATPPTGARRRVAGVLFALTAVAAAFTVAVSGGHGPDYGPATVGTVVAFATYALLRTVPGVLAAAGLTFVAGTSALEDLRGVTGVLPLGSVVLIAAGALWVVLGLTGLVLPRPLAYGVGAAIALVGGQTALDYHGWAGWPYLLTAAVAVACVALYRVRPTPVLLIAGVVGITLAVPEAVWDITNGAGGAAAILIISGAVLLAASGAGIAFRSRVDRGQVDRDPAEQGPAEQPHTSAST